MSSTTTSEWAIDVARELLADQPQRWKHNEAAIEKARSFAPAVPGEEDVLVTIVALHDVGFAEATKDTGFSTIDGARHLRKIGADERLVDLLANICCGQTEGRLRGMPEHHDDFGPDEGETPVRDAFWTCCLTTAPDGSPMTVADRCEEWTVRYAGLGIMEEYLKLCRAELEGAEARTLQRMKDAQG